MFVKKSNLMAFFYIVHGHYSVQPTEPTQLCSEAFAEDAGEKEDIEEDEGGEHVKEN